MAAQIIQYDATLVIDNLDALPRGTGAQYLECIRSHITGELIACKWRNVLTDQVTRTAEIIVRFGK